MRAAKPKPLAVVRSGRHRAEIHRAKFEPFEATKYLNLSALKKAKKARVEIGRVRAAGVEATVVAEIEKGMITKLMPLDCKGCDKAMLKRGSKGVNKKFARETLTRLRDLGLSGTPLPAALPTKSAMEVGNGWIEIGPIVIYWPPDICISVDYTDGVSCLYCLFGYGICVGPVIVN